MKIGIIMGPFLGLPPNPCGAVERIFAGLAKVFHERGHSVIFYLRRMDGENKEEVIDNIRYIRGTCLRRTNQTAQDLLKDLYYSLIMLFRIKKADIIVTNSFFMPLALRLKFWQNHHIHVNVARFPKGQMCLYKHAARLCAVSSPVAEEIKKQTPQVASIVKVIPNPIDTKTITPALLPTKYDSKQTILYTGRITQEKGLHLLLEAFKKINDEIPLLNLKIIGPWKTEQGGGGVEYLRQLKEKAGGYPIEFLDPIFDLALLSQHLRTADYFVYPSLAQYGESFGVAPLEAMAAGTLTVVSNLAVFRDFVDDGRNAFIFDHTTADPTESLAAKLKEVIRLPLPQKQTIVEAAIRRAQDFSYDCIAQRYLDDFNEILKYNIR